ncbi:MAG: hypothetical protein ACRDSH_23670 [Pseudonocardiaceae bacterium]
MRNPGKRAVQAFVSLVVLTLAVAVISLGYTTISVHRSAHDWCATLNLLTSQPVPKPADPAANPSRRQAYVLYSDFLDLRHRFGCG